MFRHKVPAIKVARDRLLDLPVEQARTGALVLGGLRRACELADTLDSCITEDMTFAKHFFNELATLPHDDESHESAGGFGFDFPCETVGFSRPARGRGRTPPLGVFRDVGRVE